MLSVVKSQIDSLGEFTHFEIGFVSEPSSSTTLFVIYKMHHFLFQVRNKKYSKSKLYVNMSNYFQISKVAGF